MHSPKDVKFVIFCVRTSAVRLTSMTKRRYLDSAIRVDFSEQDIKLLSAPLIVENCISMHRSTFARWLRKEHCPINSVPHFGSQLRFHVENPNFPFRLVLVGDGYILRDQMPR